MFLCTCVKLKNGERLNTREDVLSTPAIFTHVAQREHGSATLIYLSFSSSIYSIFIYVAYFLIQRNGGG